MRRWFMCLVVASVVLMSGGSANGQDPAPTLPPPLLAQDGLVVGALALERDLDPANLLFPPQDGMQYVAVAVGIFAMPGLTLGPQEWSYHEFSSETKGQTFSPSTAHADTSGLCPTCTPGHNRLPLSGALEEGDDAVSGWVTFEVPRQAGPIDVMFRDAVWADVPSIADSPFFVDETEGDSFTVRGHPLYGRPAPEIDLETLDGERLTLSGRRGQPVLVNFWATWCGPCRDEFPLMVAAYDEYRDDGLEILGVIHDDTADGARAFAADYGATWPMLDDPDDVAFEAYTVPGMPTSYFVDAEGIVRAFSIGGFSEAGLESQLGTILPD